MKKKKKTQRLRQEESLITQNSQSCQTQILVVFWEGVKALYSVRSSSKPVKDGGRTGTREWPQNYVDHEFGWPCTALSVTDCEADLATTLFAKGHRSSVARRGF